MKRRTQKTVFVAALTLLVASVLFPFNAYAVTSFWIQTDWSGGVGSSTVNQYASATEIDDSNVGQIELDRDYKFSNSGFETDLTGWTPSWWEAGGATGAVGVWQAKGVGSYATSRVDMSGNGNDLIEGSDPIPWSSADGWQFIAANSDYLNSGITIGPGYTALVQFAELTSANEILGVSMGSGEAFFIQPWDSDDSAVEYKSGSAMFSETVLVSPQLVAGNLAIADPKCYRNGVYEDTDIGLSAPVGALYLGAHNAVGLGTYYYIEADISAFAIFDNALDDDEVAAVVAEMAGALTQVSRDIGIKYDGSVASAKVNVQADKPFVQNIVLGDTADYTLEGYAYTNGNPVTDADAEIYVDGAAVATTYEATDEAGWYKLSAELTGVVGATDYGMEVKAGKTAYLDDVALWGYEEQGLLTSNIYDTGQSSEWGTGSWVNSGGGTVQLRVRTSNDPNMAGAPDWATCTSIGNGSDFSATTCVNDGDRYVQYQLTLLEGSTPDIEEVRITYDLADLDRTGEAGIVAILVGGGLVMVSIIAYLIFRKGKKDKSKLSNGV